MEFPLKDLPEKYKEFEGLTEEEFWNHPSWHRPDDLDLKLVLTGPKPGADLEATKGGRACHDTPPPAPVDCRPMADTPAPPQAPRDPIQELHDRNARNFTHHPSHSANQEGRHNRAREILRIAADELILITPPGREQSLALTKLEEAMLWSNAAIAREPNTLQDTAAPTAPAPSP